MVKKRSKKIISQKYLIGIDEVGRGSLAGPIVVVAAMIPTGLKVRNSSLGTMFDSKKLSAEKRELWNKYFRNHPRIKFALAKISPRVIDRINISRSANRATLRAYQKLISKIQHLPPEEDPPRAETPSTTIFLDGGLYLGNGKNRFLAKTVIRGDEKIQSIMIASIIAKVYRDKLMSRLSKKISGYGFEIHKGYGTKAHLRAIKKLGPSPVHRLSFLKNLRSPKRKGGS